MAVSIITAIGGTSDEPIGYVDLSGVLADPVYPELEEGEDFAEMRPFAGEAAAQTALEAGEIQAFYLIPGDYLQRPEVQLFYWDDPPGEIAQDDFDDFLRANLVADLPGPVQRRLSAGSELTVQSANGERSFGGDQIFSFFLPFIAGFFFFFTVMASAGYLLQVVADEKENRTVEIMVTTVSPEQLIGGKAIGLMAVALTQVGIWVLTVVLGIVIGSRYVEWLQNVAIPWEFLGIVALYFFPAYMLIAGIMTAIGGSVTELRQGQQIAGVLNLIFTIPFFFVALLFANPDSPIFVFLTLFPTTSFVTISLRWGATVIPTWQLVASWLILVTTALFSVWASARIFRAGMLRYGQELRLRSVLGAVRGE
jgi:ABC-2 type transport system permease protein